MAHLKPPPDTPANLQGRLYHLFLVAHSKAAGGIRIYVAEGKEIVKAASPKLPEDYEKRLKAALKELAPQSLQIEARLKQCLSGVPLKSRPKPEERTVKNSASLLDFMQSSDD